MVFLRKLIKTAGTCFLATLLLAPSKSVAQPADPAIAYKGTSGSENQKLVVMNADGSNAVAIYAPPQGSLDTPTWSPAGTQIAFRVNSGSSSGLWRIDVAVVNGKPKGLSPTQLTADSPGVYSGYGPAWSPAGDLIAYYAFTDNSNYTIEVVPYTGGTPTVLYTSSLSLHSPTWSPDASRIAFLERDPAYESFRIRLLDVATGVAITALAGEFAAEFCNGTGGGYKGLDWARTADLLRRFIQSKAAN